MEVRELTKKLEKIQTLIEDLEGSWPEGPADDFSVTGNALSCLEGAGNLVDDAIDLLSQVDDGGDEDQG